MTVIEPEVGPAAPRRLSTARPEGALRNRRAPLALGLFVAFAASCALWAGLIGLVGLLLH